ncbi:MAG TPA: hypothetical protein VHZ95_17730 [Polyangiales bacterium]|jgi:hypothetical protein|nr:hypothetical protein [Polyangiales bacterium]
MKTVSNLVIASILSVSGAVYAQSAANTAKPANNPPGATEKTSAVEATTAKASHAKLPGAVADKKKQVQPMAATKVEQTKSSAHKLEATSKEQHVAKTPEVKAPEKVAKPTHKAEAMVEKTPAK